MAKSYGTKVISIKREAFDHGGTRNLAASESTGDILVFMTQDAICMDPYVIDYLVKPLEKPEIVLSYARQLPKPGSKITDVFLRLYNYPPTTCIKSKADIGVMGIKAFQNSNVCSAYSREKFEQLGGFHQPVVSNEDMLFAAKAILSGYKTAYSAKAMVLHSHNYSFTQLLRRYFDIAASLENEPAIKMFGKTELKGANFIFEQIKYLKNERELASIPVVLIEAVAKFLGYKLGCRHSLIPAGWKKFLGLNRIYWDRLASGRHIKKL